MCYKCCGTFSCRATVSLQLVQLEISCAMHRWPETAAVGLSLFAYTSLALGYSAAAYGIGRCKWSRHPAGCILRAYTQPQAALDLAGADEPLDPRLLWLAPGSATSDPKKPGASAAAPWFQQHSSRRDFLARLVEQLLAAGQQLPGAGDWRGHLCHALLAVEAAVCQDESAGNPEGAPLGAPLRGPHPERARGTAKRLLALRREDMDLWAAYAQLEAQAGNVKVTNACNCL